ncbi:unnamed protein product [Rotaria sp. Silwood2]|nr:unnamed protein product [Rotaria sp. Silwood2]CAF4132945.1 unnamed protein product [Rotaria sp. Silwood2]CAF4200204.1 unnamed protein product [Rotaria sp. Silwood2]
MSHAISFVLFIVLSLTEGISAEWCYDGSLSYYCSSGQSCGSYYNDCRGLPTYAIIGIVGISIAILSICIRCCVQLNSNNTRQTPPAVPISIQNPGHRRAQVYVTRNNMTARSSTIVPVHCIREDAPPSYAAATSSTTELPKY